MKNTHNTPFRALPFQNVYASYAWAKDDAFAGYYALIPTRGSLRDKNLIRVRRDSLRRVLDLVLADLTHRMSRTRHPDARHQLEQRIERIRRVNPEKLPLPTRFVIRYQSIIRSGHKDNQHRNAAMHLDRIEQHVRWVYLADYIRYGIVRALALGGSPLDEGEAYADGTEEASCEHSEEVWS